MSYIIEPQPRVSTPMRGQTPPPLRAPVTSPLTSPPTPPARVLVTPGIVRAPARPVRRHRIQRTRTAIVRKLFNGMFLNICNYMDDYFNMIKKSGIYTFICSCTFVYRSGFWSVWTSTPASERQKTPRCYPPAVPGNPPVTLQSNTYFYFLLFEHMW